MYKWITTWDQKKVSLFEECLTCNGGPCRHGQRVESQKEADGLWGTLLTDQVESDGSDQSDETAVEGAHEQADGDEPGERIGQGQQHREDADGEEGGLDRNEIVDERSWKMEIDQSTVTCCKMTRLTPAKSPILPKTKRPTPDVMPMQRTRSLPSASGRISLT